MTLLSLTRDAADEIGITQPATVAGNSAPEAQKLLRYANKVGNRLMKLVAWQVLRKEQAFTAIAGETQTGILPSDFDRFVPETFWDRTATRLISGPVTSNEWSGLKATVYNSANRKFAYRGGAVLVIPVFAGGESVAFEYVSNQWALATDGTTYKTTLSVDTDTSILDEELITLGVIYEFLLGEGLPAGDAAVAYEKRFNMMIENDQPASGVMVAGDLFSGSGSRHYSGTPPAGGTVALL